jgi:oligogalacturonide transport system permease protein
MRNYSSAFFPNFIYKELTMMEVSRKTLKEVSRNTVSKSKRKYIGLLYISPWIIGFLVFQLYPFIASLVYSFTDYTLLSKPEYVGFDNYVYMFTKDDNFYQSLKATFLYVLMAVPGKLIFALIIAMILNVKIKGVGTYRTVYYLPSILGGSVAISILWQFLFMKEGIINNIFSSLHIKPIDWLGDPKFSLFTISLLTIWQFGSSMVIFLAGLKNIPSELYEAARVDGSSRVRTFFSVTLPMLSPIILFNLVMQTINTFQEFTSAFVITGGGPIKSTYLYGMMLYENAFSYYKMGYASAQSWVLFIIMIIISIIIFLTAKKWTFYEDGGGLL